MLLNRFSIQKIFSLYSKCPLNFFLWCLLSFLLKPTEQYDYFAVAKAGENPIDVTLISDPDFIQSIRS